MNILSNKAVRQLVDSIDQSAALDMIGVQVAKLTNLFKGRQQIL
jgi:hypothetical protein